MGCGIATALCVKGEYGSAAVAALATIAIVWFVKFVAAGAKALPETQPDSADRPTFPVQVGPEVRRIRQGVVLGSVAVAALVSIGVWLAIRHKGIRNEHLAHGFGTLVTLACAAVMVMLVATVPRVALSWLSHQLGDCPSLWPGIALEGAVLVLGLVAVDMLFVPWPAGPGRLVATVSALILSLGSLCGYMFVGWKRIEVLTTFDVLSLQDRCLLRVNAKMGLSGRAILTTLVKVVISAIAAITCVLPLVGSGMAVAAAVTEAIAKPVQDVTPVSPEVEIPQPASTPAPGTLGTSGYDAICGSEPDQQPGYGTTGTIYDGFVRVWSGAGIGLGGYLAGCWGPAEVIPQPDGLTVAYDLGSVNGKVKSLAIAVSNGEAEIYLVDGNREAYAAGLLAKHELITGTQRYSIFAGDFQLIYTPLGTVTTIRQVTHQAATPNLSQMAVMLTEPETVAWLDAMKLSGGWLWPTALPAGYGCSSEVSFVTESGQSVATVCPEADPKSATLTVAGQGGLGGTQVLTVTANGTHTSWGQILNLAG
jgi:hypothetical protein